MRIAQRVLLLVALVFACSWGCGSDANEHLEAVRVRYQKALSQVERLGLKDKVITDETKLSDKERAALEELRFEREALELAIKAVND